MPVNVGDALKSQKKGLKLDVTRMGYTWVYADMHVQNYREFVRGGNCSSKHRVIACGGNYLLNGPGG